MVCEYYKQGCTCLTRKRHSKLVETKVVEREVLEELPGRLNRFNSHHWGKIMIMSDIQKLKKVLEDV